MTRTIIVVAAGIVEIAAAQMGINTSLVIAKNASVWTPAMCQKARKVAAAYVGKHTLQTMATVMMIITIAVATGIRAIAVGPMGRNTNTVTAESRRQVASALILLLRPPNKAS